MAQSLLSFAVPQRSSMGLRHYQEAALAAIKLDLEQQQNTLAILATGLGKTQIFVQLAAGWTDRDVLVLCHRDELVRQAQNRFASFGIDAEIEQAELRASASARVVIASVQTLAKKARLSAFDPQRFGLIICDEVHHFVDNTYVRPLKYFTNHKAAGFTATPDRADKRAMGRQWGSVAYMRDILDGIDDGYLVRVKVLTVRVDSIDLSAVKKTKGDLAIGALDEAMLKAVEGVVAKTLELEPGRRGIAFFPGVRSAALACERFNQLKPGSAALVVGDTDPDVRRKIIRGCHEGRYQYLCGCGVPTEGFDWPECDLIVQARPTLSRALCAQMVGRGTRPLPGLVDSYGGPEGAEARCNAIAASAKPNVMVLDFVGTIGTRHKLVTPGDVLGGRFTDDERKLAAKKARRAKKTGVDFLDLLREARSELQRVSTAKSRVDATVTEADPFSLLGLKREQRGASFLNQKFGAEPIMPGQMAFLEGKLCTKNGWKPADVANLTKREAARLIQELIGRAKSGRASFKQLAVLREHGWTDTNLSMEQARKALDYISSLGWDKRRVDRDKLCRIITGYPEVGTLGTPLPKKPPTPKPAPDPTLPGIPEPVNLLDYL